MNFGFFFTNPKGMMTNSDDKALTLLIKLEAFNIESTKINK